MAKRKLPDPPPTPPLPDNQIRVVGRQESECWKVEMLETPHAWFYMFSQRGVVNQLMGEPQRIWVLSPQSMGIMKPEWAARATKIQGDAMAEVQGKIVAAAQQAMCDECQGKQKGPDEAPCWKCHGRRP